jgi:hypothetical protein
MVVVAFGVELRRLEVLTVGSERTQERSYDTG